MIRTEKLPEDLTLLLLIEVEGRLIAVPLGYASADTTDLDSMTLNTMLTRAAGLLAARCPTS